MCVYLGSFPIIKLITATHMHACIRIRSHVTTTSSTVVHAMHVHSFHMHTRTYVPNCLTNSDEQNWLMMTR